MKDSTNGKKPTKTFKIQRPDLGVRKPRGSDINWSNICGDKTTHLVDCIESHNTPNSSYNKKKRVTHLR
jgi:hypothetical protein